MKQMFVVALFCLIVVGCVNCPLDTQPQRSISPQQVIGKTWQWVATLGSTEKALAGDPRRYTLLLQDDDRAQVRFDCNLGGGRYEVAEGELSFGPMISTRKGCPPDSQADWFARDLQRVRSFYLENGQLHLEFPDGIMIFREKR